MQWPHTAGRDQLTVVSFWDMVKVIETLVGDPTEPLLRKSKLVWSKVFSELFIGNKPKYYLTSLLVYQANSTDVWFFIFS